jgi:hypothetical protein
MTEKYVPPSFEGDAFNCPYCGAYAHQIWGRLSIEMESVFISKSVMMLSTCKRCNKFSVWLSEKLMYPSSSTAPMPSDDMPGDVAFDYKEAREIVNLSPRSACALLRLALQKLMPHLGEKSKDLNKDIGNLVKKGLPATIQKAADIVRVIGNNAVHPGEIDLKDDAETASKLFGLTNLIVEVMISQPKRVDLLYEKIPATQKEQIEKRDKNSK